MEEIKGIPVSCNRDCGAGCPLTAYIKNGIITQIKDSTYKHSYMRGCLKGYRMMDTVYHIQRLKKPLIRSGIRGSGKFRESGWDEALDLISEKMRILKNRNSSSSLMRIGGSGSCRGALHNTDSLTRRFLSFYGGYTETKGNFSSEAATFVKPSIFGTPYVGIDSKTLLNSKLIILWGFNPSDTRFDCEIEAVLKEVSQKDIPILVVDPRKTSTIRNYNAKWIPILPGTDSVFMLAILWILIDKKLINRNYIKKYSYGFNDLEEYILGKTDGIIKDPQWAEKICGLSKEKITEFAILYSNADRAALIPGLSLQRAIGGENTDRLGAVLQLATGNTGKHGGSTGCSTWNKLIKPECGSISVPDNKSIVEVPVYKWADAVIEGVTGGYPSDITFLYNVGGNYLGQGSNTGKTIEAFEKVDFSVTHDYFMTMSARYSDVILPVTTFLEREDIVNAPNNYLFYSAKAIEPIHDSKNDYWIFSQLAKRLGFYDSFTEGKTEKEWIEQFIRESEIDDPVDFKKRGLYAGTDQQRIGLSDFITDPEKYPLLTETGKIEIASEIFQSLGGTLIPEPIVFSTTVLYPLRMITPHERYRIHSQNDNVPSLKKLCKDTLWINPFDAEKRDIPDGAMVVVKSETGNISTTAFVTDRITKGVVSLNQGAWPEFSNDLRMYKNNCNFITSTTPTTPSNGSRTHSNSVEVILLSRFKALRLKRE